MDVKWYKLKELATENFDDIHNVPGIYFVRWSKNGNPEPVSRLKGIDKQGLLYTGRAKKLRMRVKQLWKGINRKERHTIGKTIIFCKVFELINLDEYEISWEELKTHEEAIGQEWTAIKLYADKYKEPPPLNLGIRREQFMIIGIGKVGKSRIGYDPDEFVKSIIDERESTHK